MEPAERPSTPLQAFDIVPPRLVNIVTLLRIFCMLPLSTCTAERAFSAMKLLKNYLRNIMTDDRLTGLALMYIHPEVDIDDDSVIRRFTAMSAKADQHGRLLPPISQTPYRQQQHQHHQWNTANCVTCPDPTETMLPRPSSRRGVYPHSVTLWCLPNTGYTPSPAIHGSTTKDRRALLSAYAND